MPDREALSDRRTAQAEGWRKIAVADAKAWRARAEAAEAENESLHRRIKNMAADVNERLDWIARDKRESDKVLSGVSTARSVLIRYVLLSPAPDAREALNGGDR